jgi:hypothetical protein
MHSWILGPPKAHAIPSNTARTRGMHARLLANVRALAISSASGSMTINQRWRYTYERGRSAAGTETLVRSVTTSLAPVWTLNCSRNRCASASCCLVRPGKVMKTIARQGRRRRLISEHFACFSVSAPSPLSGSSNTRLAPSKAARVCIFHAFRRRRGRDRLAMKYGRFRPNCSRPQCSDTALR